MRKITRIAIVAGMCLNLAACGKTPKDVSTKDNEPKSIALSSSWSFEHFYPLVSPESGSNYGITYWSQSFYDTLLEVDSKGELQGRLATNWEMSEDGKNYTFHLRDGVNFSDGTPLTADAVVQSYQAAQQVLGDYASSYSKTLSLITDMQAKDEKTFVMTLSTPYYNTLQDLTSCMVFAVINPAAFKNGVENVYETCKSGTMGTGAYVYSQKQDNITTFVKNEYYWGDAPDVDTFTVKVIEDNDARMLALRNGEIDAITTSENLSADGFKELEGTDGFTTAVDKASAQTRYLGFNMSQAPFDDENVRKAVAYTINQQELSDTVFNGLETAAETWYPTNMVYCDKSNAKGYETDAKKAMELLEQAGWKDSNGDGIREKDGKTLTVDFKYTQSLASIDNAILAIKASLEDVGFQVNIAGEEMMTFYTDVMNNNYSMAFWFSNGGSLDPTSGISNIMAMADPVLYQFQSYITGGTDIITELESTTDSNRVQEIYNTVLNDVDQQALMVPVSYINQLSVWNSANVEQYTFCTDARYTDVANFKVK